jgi:hypothetical protein
VWNEILRGGQRLIGHLPRIVEAGAISSIPSQGAQVYYLPGAGEQVPKGQDLALVIDGCG